MGRCGFTLSWLVAVVVTLHATRARAATSYDAMVDSLLHARSPRAESLFAQANRDRDLGDSFGAIDLYGKVLAIVPDFAPASRRLAMIRLSLGQRDDALQQLRDLVQRDSSAYTLAALATALISTRGQTKPSRVELDEARLLALRAVRELPDDVSCWQTLFQVGLARGDSRMVHDGVEAMCRLSPNDWVSWAGLAIYEQGFEHRDDLARAALDHARRTGMPAQDAAELESSFGQARAAYGRMGLLELIGWSLLAWGIAFLVLLGIGMVLSRVTLRAADRLLQDRHGQGLNLARWLRSTYRGVLWLCCAFYYLSVPIVLIVVLLLGAGLIYFFFVVGQIPVRLVALVAALTLVTVFSVVRSLRVRGSDQIPGAKLDLTVHPRLRELLDRVATRIGTRPVDDVYMTPGTEIAVLEQGGLRRELGGSAQRCLLLGAGVLGGMTVGQLKAILAHEYGHFSHRDTAGGGFALSVRRSLLTMARRLAVGGAAGWFNPAWLFVRGFYAVFMRISQGASRLQEILADRLAALTYGSSAFVAGLRHVIEASVRFPAHANAAVREVLRDQQPLPNLYRYEPQDAPPSEAVAARVDEAIGAPPSVYDSHPAPRQRIDWVNSLSAAGEDMDPSDAGEAWSLFADREALEAEMTARVRASVEAAHSVKFTSATT